MEIRHDKCKCGKNIVWDLDQNTNVTCKHCNTTYTIESDSVLIYWLKERLENQKPYQTEAR